MPDKSTNIAEKNTKALSTLDESYFQHNARLGIEHINQDDLPTPILKIVNSEVLRADGQTPVRYGKFYYPALDVEADTLVCSFLTYTKEMQEKYKQPGVMEKVYVVMGALDSKSGFKPFKMYFRSTGIGAFKRLLGQVTAQNKPLFAFELELTSEKRVSQENKTYYTLVINNKGIRQNSEKILTLEELTREYSTVIGVDNAQAEDKSVETTIEPEQEESDPNAPIDPDQVVNPDEIPF